MHRPGRLQHLCGCWGCKWSRGSWRNTSDRLKAALVLLRRGNGDMKPTAQSKEDTGGDGSDSSIPSRNEKQQFKSIISPKHPRCFCG